MNERVDGQDEVIAFLGNPANHGGRQVRRIDTHAASVFLAGDRALKIKRAVRFPFLDYSTLDKRKQACEAELAINAPYAPKIYCRVMLFDKARRIIAAGHSAIVDAVFAREQERKALSATANSAGIRLIGLFLTADLAIRLSRVGERTADASDADEEVARAQECYELGSLEWTETDASGTVEETLSRARAALD